MPETRTEEQVQADLAALAQRFNDREIEDLGEFKAEQQKLTSELATLQTNARMAQEDRKHTKERNERVYNEVLKEKFGVSLADVRKDPNKADLKVKFFESVVLSHQSEMLDAAADGESAVRQWLTEVADLVEGEINKFREPDGKAAADAGDEGADEDADSDAAPERPEPTDISDIPNSDTVPAQDIGGAASKAFLKMIDGHPMSEDETGLVNANIEIGSFEDQGLPIDEQEPFWGKRPR